MKSFAFTSRALSVSIAAVLLTGCGGSPLPSGATSSPLQRIASPDRLSRAGSWMKSEAKRGDLLYISDQGTRHIDVFSYPRGKLVGKLYGFVAPRESASTEPDTSSLPMPRITISSSTLTAKKCRSKR